MHRSLALYFAGVPLLVAMALATGAAAQGATSIDSRFAEVNGTKLHYLIAGKGPPVLLLHGYAQNSHMWRPLMAELGKTRTVIAPDLRGFGHRTSRSRATTSRPWRGTCTPSRPRWGTQHVAIAGHDIGLMVAYAYAAQYPADVDRIVLMDAFLPGVGDWTSVWLLRDLWHFHFYGKTPLALVDGRERIYFEHFWNDFAADPAHSVSEADRQVLRGSLCAARRHAGRLRGVPRLRAGRQGVRRFRQDQAEDADAGAVRRKGLGRIPDRPRDAWSPTTSRG